MWGLRSMDTAVIGNQLASKPVYYCIKLEQFAVMSQICTLVLQSIAPGQKHERPWVGSNHQPFG